MVVIFYRKDTQIQYGRILMRKRRTIQVKYLQYEYIP